MGIFNRLFNFAGKKPVRAEGFAAKPTPQKRKINAFVLEQMRTPSGLLDVGNHGSDLGIIELPNNDFSTVELPHLGDNFDGNSLDLGLESHSELFPALVDHDSDLGVDGSLALLTDHPGEIEDVPFIESGHIVDDGTVELPGVSEGHGELLVDGTGSFDGLEFEDVPPLLTDHPGEIEDVLFIESGHIVDDGTVELPGVSEGHGELLVDGTGSFDGLEFEDVPFADGHEIHHEDGLTGHDVADINHVELSAIVDYQPTFESGMFTVGDSGQVQIDFKFDGGGYQGELAIFSLDGMDQFDPGSHDFIQEAASRALSDSVLGHVVISDRTEGARFFGELGESDWNAGEYLGVKTFEMRSGDEFGFMLIPNSTVQKVFDNPDIDGAGRPLFSMATANPNDAFHLGQIADVTGDGTTFVMEDLRVDTGSDRDYNDIIFRVSGASGKAVTMDRLIADGIIDPDRDWRTTELGQQITFNVESYAAPGKELPGDPIHPALPEPTVPQTNVDQGGNGFSELTLPHDEIVEPNQGGALPNTPTSIKASLTQDIIDQVSNIDPTDVYQVSSHQLTDTEISVLSGNTSVSILTPEGEVLSQQVLTRGTHSLTVPDNVSGKVLLKFDSQNSSNATYILRGFESKAPEPFNIDVQFESGVTASQQAVIQAAARSVESLIGQGLPSAIVDGKIIDDVNFKIAVTNLDGAGGTLAQTKIDFMRYGTLLPAQSITQFDVNDIAQLEQSGQLFSVVQHEILHGLGFGNLWEAKGLVDYAGTPLAQYNGEHGVTAFKEVGGLTDAIPLETDGEGSAGLHWHEAVFQDEVMTRDLGFQTGENGQVTSPISAVTLAALVDLGYQVNVNKSTPGWGLFGGKQLKEEDLTEEQIEEFRKLAEESFAQPDDEFIYAVMPEVDLAKVAPEIWAHAERFWKNGQYYDWQRYQVQWGDTLSQIALDTMGSAHPDYYWWIANHNGIPNPDYIVASDGTRKQWIEIPRHYPNYEQEQEDKRKAAQAELDRLQQEEAQKQKEAQEKLEKDLAQQERLKQEQEKLQQEAEAKQKELEEQAKRLAEELEKKRQQDELLKEQARLAELARQAEIARQQGKGGQEWYFAKPLPEFGPVDPFETKLTGETVGNLVPDDYYRFTLSRPGRIDARLMKLLADADLVLYDVRNRPISYSMREGITDEQILVDLIPGTYLLRVNSPKGVTTDYELIVKFKHLLSQSEIGPPPGWRVGGGNGGGGGTTGPIFADPRIESIYNTALNNFAAPERANANARIQQLERDKQSYQQELQQLLDQMNSQQRNKVNAALYNVLNDGNIWVDNIAEPIKKTMEDIANGIINQIDSTIPGWVYNTPIGNALRNGKDNLKGAINGAKSWLTGQISWVQSVIKGYLSSFIETIKNAYRTGAEINGIIEQAAINMKRGIDGIVGGINNWVGEFKGKILGGLGWLQNVGAFGWNFYDSVVEPLVNSIANGVQGAVSSVRSFANNAVNWIKPRAQTAVAAVVDAIFGDKTGYLYNKIHGVDAQIAATRTGLENAISAAGTRILGVVRQIEAFLTDPEERKRVLDALFRRGYQTAEEAYKFIQDTLQTVQEEIAKDNLQKEINLSPGEEDLFKEVVLQSNPQLIKDYDFLKNVAQANINNLSSFSGISLPDSEHLKKKFLNEPGNWNPLSKSGNFSYMELLQNKLGVMSLAEALNAYDRIGNAINSYPFKDHALANSVSNNARRIVEENYNNLSAITEKYKAQYTLSNSIITGLQNSVNGIYRAILLGGHLSKILLEIETFGGKLPLVKSAYNDIVSENSGQTIETAKTILDLLLNITQVLETIRDNNFDEAFKKVSQLLSKTKTVDNLLKTSLGGNLLPAVYITKLSKLLDSFQDLTSVNELLTNLKKIEGKYINSDDIEFVYWSKNYLTVNTFLDTVDVLNTLVSSTQISGLKSANIMNFLNSVTSITDSLKEAMWNIFEELNATNMQSQNAIFSYGAEYGHTAIKGGFQAIQYVLQKMIPSL